jgi:hypothetical protein
MFSFIHQTAFSGFFKRFFDWRRATACFFLTISGQLYAQSPGVPLHSPAYHILDRLDIRSGVESDIHPELKFFARKDAVSYAIKVDSSAPALSTLDKADLQYLIDDNNEWYSENSIYHRRNRKNLFKVFYKTPANFFEVNAKDFKLRVNPMFNFYFAREKGDSGLVFANQRGLEVRGEVDKKVFFYTNLLESQARYPSFVTDRILWYKAVPGGPGLYKDYRPRTANFVNAVDFNVANAYIGFNVTKHVGVQLGHGQHFIGNGYRSLFLSDFGANTFYLKLNTRVWRFHYQNLFMELSPGTVNSVGGGAERIPKKYVAAHYLNYRVTPRLSVGLFEATVLNRSRQFELQYLNPVILYRSVEGLIGSPDNVLIGFDARWNAFRRFQFYGQFMLDEFLFAALVNPEQSGWWGNKFGIQAGMKYIDAFGIDHLDLRAEVNIARPFTYSHGDSLNSYTHGNQPLAHPLGANFEEFIGVLRYQPHPKLTLAARAVVMNAGENTADQNWGADPLLSYNRRVQEYGNVIGQGVGADILLAGLDVSWQLYHNLFLDLKLLYRRKDSDDDRRDLNSKVFGVGLRMNAWSAPMDF